MKHQHDMAKIQIKSEKLTPFGGIFPIMEYFNSKLSPVIDRVLGLRCKQFGYQYSEIIRSLMCVYLCGGSCIEDLSPHLLRHLSLHPTMRTCSSDTVLRIMGELKEANVTYTSETGRSYDFNTADRLNDLLVESLLATGQLKAGEKYDFDFDHEFLEAEKYDAKRTYKKFLGYSPGAGVIGNLVVGIENRDGNANVRKGSRTPLSACSPGSKAAVSASKEPEWTAAPVQGKSSRPCQDTASIIISVAAAASQFTTKSLRSGDGSV